MFIIDASTIELLSLILLVMNDSRDCMCRWIITIRERKRRSNHNINGHSREWNCGRGCIGRFQYHKCIGRSGGRIVLCKIDRFCNHISLTGSDTCIDTNFG